MAIPDYQSLMLPLLHVASDGKEHLLNEMIETLADEFKLTLDEKKELLPSGRQAIFDNRVAWARTYLKKARLLESTGRGKFKITDRGLQTLEAKPVFINTKFLRQFPEFIDFQNSPKRSDSVEMDSTKPETPEETLEVSHQYLEKALSQELLDRIKRCSPKFFEQLVVDLLVGMGYGGSRQNAGQAVGQSGDGGIDGIINEDKLGLDVVYIQAKRWESPIGRPVVQAFAGSLEGHRARKGVLITSSYFTQDAKEYVNRIEKKIVLIDGNQLSQLMIEHGIG